MSAQSSYLNKKGLTVKDLVTIGIFTALFFVFELIGYHQRHHLVYIRHALGNGLGIYRHGYCS